MSKLKKYLLPLVAGVIILCLILSMFCGCAPAATTEPQQESSPSLGDILDPSGNPFVNRFSDEKDIRTATFVVAASDSVHRYDGDFRCSGANDHIQIQAALDRLPATGGHIFLLDGTYTLGAQVLRAIDDVKFMGCGQATLLNLDGGTPVITAGAQDGWLFTHFATDAGGPSIAAASESAIRSVWIAGVRTDDPAAVDVVPATLVVAASDSVDPTRADYQCSGAADDVDINAALTTAAGGKVVLLEGNYQITANLVVPASTHLSGMGKGTILTTTAAVGITNMVVVNGHNVTVSDMKLVLGAGAGDAGSRPNVVYGNTKTLIWLENLWIVGDSTVAYDASLDRQNGILLDTVTDSKLTNNKIEDNKSSGIRIVDSSFNTLTGNTSESNGHDGIQVHTSAADSEYNVVSTNTCNGNSWKGIANLGSSNHNTYDSNACEGNAEAGIAISAGTGNTVTGNTCSENVVGITTSGSYTDIVGNTCYGNTTEEIKVTGDYSNITGNMIWSEVGDHSIYLNSADYCTVSGNSCFGAGAIILCSAITNCTITGNLVQGGIGISLATTSDHNTITGNTCSNGVDGIKLNESDYNTITGNTCRDNSAKGIYSYRSSYNTIVGNTLYSNAEYGIYCHGTAGKPADFNFVTSNNCRDNTYNIEVSGGANANHNRIIDNEVSGGTALVVDAGTNTEFNSVIVPFSDGTDPQDSGYEIDTNNEMARAWLKLPAEVQIVLKITVYARSVVAEVHEMELEMVVLGGADNEAYNTHTGSIAQLDSTSVNFAVDDIIFWTNTEAGTLLLTGGDSIEVKVLHEAAEGDNCQTDAFFRTVEIEYQ